MVMHTLCGQGISVAAWSKLADMLLFFFYERDPDADEPDCHDWHK